MVKTPLWHYTLFLLKKPISYVYFSCQMFHSLLNFPIKRERILLLIWYRSDTMHVQHSSNRCERSEKLNFLNFQTLHRFLAECCWSCGWVETSSGVWKTLCQLTAIFWGSNIGAIPFTETIMLFVYEVLQTKCV